MVAKATVFDMSESFVLKLHTLKVFLHSRMTESTDKSS